MRSVTFQNSQNTNLAGVYRASSSQIGIVIAAGFTSTKDRSRFISLTQSLSSLEVGILRFDWTGSGESDDGPITVSQYVDDFKAACQFMVQQGHSSLIYIAESLGAVAALENYQQNVPAMVLWAPVTKGKEPSIYREQQQSFESLGYATLQKDGKSFIIPQQYLDERRTINTQNLFANVNCPILTLHGNQDSTVPLEHSLQAQSYYPLGSKLEIIPNANHKFQGHEQIIITKTVEWIQRFL